MKWLSRKLLAQSFESNIFSNRDHKCSRTALRNEVLSVYHNGTDPIAKMAERLVRFLKVLSAICNDEAGHVLGNENGRTPPALGKFLDDSRPLPKQARSGSNFHSIEIACEREVLAGK